MPMTWLDLALLVPVLTGVLYAIVTVPADSAPEVCELLTEAGIKGILNFLF